MQRRERSEVRFDTVFVRCHEGLGERATTEHTSHELVERGLVVGDPCRWWRRRKHMDWAVRVDAQLRGQLPDSLDPHVRVDHHPVRFTSKLDESPVRSSRGARLCHGNGRAHWVGDQVLWRTHVKTFLAVRFVAGGCRCHRDVHIVVTRSKTTPMLVLLDSRDVGKERNARDVIELKRGMSRVVWAPTKCFEGAEMRLDVDVGTERTADEPRVMHVQDPLTGRLAHRPPSSAAPKRFQRSVRFRWHVCHEEALDRGPVDIVVRRLRPKCTGTVLPH